MAGRLTPRSVEEHSDGGMTDESLDIYDDDSKKHGIGHRTIKGPPLEVLVNICPQPPYIKDMQDVRINNCIFMIRPFKYNPTNRSREPAPIND
ncbi:unnamed protein product, partial [Rotaria magnacalcarata]